MDKTVNTLKERSQDERKVVAGGVAALVVAVLFVGWAFLFFKKIQKGATLDSFGTTQQAEFDFSTVRDAQDQISTEYQSAIDELQRIRESSISTQGSSENSLDTSGSGGYEDPFLELERLAQ